VEDPAVGPMPLPHVDLQMVARYELVVGDRSHHMLVVGPDRHLGGLVTHPVCRVGDEDLLAAVAEEGQVLLPLLIDHVYIPSLTAQVIDGDQFVLVHVPDGLTGQFLNQSVLLAQGAVSLFDELDRRSPIVATT